MHGLAPRLAGGLAAFLGLAFALGGSWIAGLHRLFPRMDPFRALAAAWRRRAGVIGAVAIAGFVSLFAAAILAVAWFATPVAWLGAVLLAAAACWLWWEALRQLRGALQAPSPPPPAEEGGPVGPV